MKRTDGERRGQRAPGVVTRSNQRLTTAIERLTRRNEHLTQVGEAKARFFANVSHELRTPLALILGPVEKHLRETPGMDASLRRDLEVVQRNARTVLRHVNNLLDVAKIEAGRGTSDYTRTDAAVLVREVSRHFSALADEQHITFVVEAPARLLVDTDAVKLHSIVLNLMSNAFKFTPAGGRVRMTLREAGQRFQLEVGDSGPGIPADQRQAVFNRFEQLEGEGTRRHIGTGLGLSIVRDFAALLGGTVSAGEAPECGALFVLDLPIAASAGTIVRPAAGESAVTPAVEDVVDALRQARVTEPPVRTTTGAAGRVLVVEDSPDMNRFIANCLSSEGFDVTAAFDGVQGYETATAEHPDLVVTDIVMPRMTGDELIRRLRQRPDFRSTPILVLGAKSDDELRLRLQRDDAQDYLDKPFSVDELRVRARTLVARKRAADQATSARQLDAVAVARTAISKAVASLPGASVQMAFQTLALEAQNLTAATYAAVAIGSEVEHPFDVWAVTGLSADEMAAVGRHPGPVGLLGLVGTEGKTMRRSSLAVPIRYYGHTVGYVYLGNKRGGTGFTEEEQHLVEALAARAGAAIQTARQSAPGEPVNAWLQAVIDQMPDGIQLMDQHGHVTLVNRSLRALAKAGPPAADRYGNSITIDFREPSGESVAADDLPIVKAIAGQQITRRRELFARRYDKALVPLHVSAAPIFTPDGTCAGAAMVVRDISTLRHAGRLHGDWASIAAPDRWQPIGGLAPRRSLARAQAADRSSAKSAGKHAPRRRV
jgi:PAS domain S-box-containing protein